jgi:endoglucanase
MGIDRRKFLLGAAATALAGPGDQFGARFQVGVNLAGLEFPYPAPAGPTEFAYYRSKRIGVFRIPFLWEMLQPRLGGDLSDHYLDLLKQVADDAASQGQTIILDAHNYGRYDKTPIGVGAVGFASLADLWNRTARIFVDHPGVLGFDLMNETHDMGSPAAWPLAAQAAVHGVRGSDGKKTIFIEGDKWSSARHWLLFNEGLNIEDPGKNLVYSAHQYADYDATGTYKKSYADDGASPSTLLDRVDPFIRWLQARGHRGQIGECGVPPQQPWLVCLDRLLARLQTMRIPLLYWAGGPAWGDYRLSCEPRGGEDAPQMTMLEKYV